MTRQPSTRLRRDVVSFLVAVALAVLTVPSLALALEEAPPTGHGGHGAHAGQAAEGNHADHHDPTSEATAEERAAADRLLAATREGTARFADFDVAAADGYVQATSFAFYGLRAAHFFNPAYTRDGNLLNPRRPETLMYLKGNDGTLELIGVMYTAPAGEGPLVGGPITPWHAHPDLCGARGGLVLMNADGACPPGAFPLDFEMLHVWLTDVPGGPFADNPLGEIDGPLVGAGDPHNSIVAGAGLIDAAAMQGEIGELLRLEPEEIARRYDAGENLAEMAAAQGVERAAVVDLLSRLTIAGLDEGMERGDVLAPQRDLILRHLPSQIERMVEIRAGEPWVRPAAG